MQAIFLFRQLKELIHYYKLSRRIHKMQDYM